MTRTIASLVALGSLFAATQAHAFAIYFDIGGTTVFDVGTSDFVTVEVRADIDVVGLDVLSVAVLFDPFHLAYNPGLSGAPAYMLYSPANGSVPSVYMVPSQNPPQLWPAPPPGYQQINVNWQLANVFGSSTQVTGANLLLGTLVFHLQVTQISQIELAPGGPIGGPPVVGGMIARVNGLDVYPSIVVGPPVVVGGIVPEPATALFVGAGLVALGMRRRRSRGSH